MAANLPGQSSRLCGQAIQVASWGSHSAGMRQAGSAETTFMVIRAVRGNSGPASSRLPRCVPCGLRYDSNRGRSRIPPAASRPLLASTLETAAMAAGKTILLVDDDPDILGAMQTIFTQEGYRVLTAADGNRALALAERDAPEVVVVDMMMP